MDRDGKTGDGSVRLKTRERVLLAAGELFARNGFDATAVRDILELADAHSAAVHYHYHSKERLHLEALRYVLRRVVAQSANVLPGVSGELTPCEAARGIAALIDRTVRNYLSPTLPRWHIQLVIRSLATEDAEIRRVVHEVLHPEHEALMRLICRAVPGTSEREGYLYAFSVTGQVVFYCLAGDMVPPVLGDADYSDVLLGELSAHVTRLTLRGLGLPDA